MANQIPVYYYKNTYVGKQSHFPNPPKPFVAHVDDLQYIFHLGYFTMIQNDGAENGMVERMTSMWTHFAANSTPNYRDDFEWTLYNPHDENYLNIGGGDGVVMEKNLFPERFVVWDKLFPVP